jgi:hypothetical protein
MNNQITRNNNRHNRGQNQQVVTSRRSRNNNYNNQALTSRRSRNNNRALWTDPQIQLLLQERRRRNFEYHYLYPGRSRVAFWQQIANTVNATFNTNYTDVQCVNKFNSLVSEYHVSKIYNDILFIMILLIIFNFISVKF